MSLDWSIRQVNNHEELMKDDLEVAKTNYIVWASLCIDMPRITEKNAKEYFNRIGCWEAICGGPIYHLPMRVVETKHGSREEPYELTLQDVIRRVNLYTNVSEKTHNQFMNKCKEHLEQTYFK